MLNSIFLQIVTTAGVAVDTVASVVAQPAAAAVLPPPPLAKEASLSLLEMIMKGGYIMIPIGILSLLAIYVMIERIMVISKASKYDKNFMSTIRDFILSGNIDAAKAVCKNTNSPQSRIVEKGISKIGMPIKDIRESLEDTGKMEVYKLERNLGILSIVGRIAPMLGFIGTIMGVITIFYNISLADNISIGLISGGLYQKMVTSAGGLVVGVVAFIAYHWLNIIVDKIAHRLEHSAVQFIEILQEPTK